MEDVNETKRIISAYVLSVPDPVTNEILYTIKDLVMMETFIADFHKRFYIPLIQNLSFHLTHVCIIGTHHYGNTLHETLSITNIFKMCMFVMIIQNKW